MTTLAFDIYGTLIDTFGIASALRPRLNESAAAFALGWREKQLEYTFRRGLMRDYQDFTVCTRQALAYVNTKHGNPLSEDDQQRLLAQYRKLPAFPDALLALEELKNTRARLFAFSNGVQAEVEALLENAGLLDWVEAVVSVDEVRSFKPDPQVYAHFLARTGARADDTWLISGNPFDVLGAMAAGWRAAWVQRDAKAVFDPWERQPTEIVSELDQLPALLAE
jgi:2-haloacid dehalogenase